MGKVLPELTDGLRGFIARQQLFFVATGDGSHFFSETGDEHVAQARP